MSYPLKTSANNPGCAWTPGPGASTHTEFWRDLSWNMGDEAANAACSAIDVAVRDVRVTFEEARRAVLTTLMLELGGRPARVAVHTLVKAWGVDDVWALYCTEEYD